MGRRSLEKGAKTLIIWDINSDALDSVRAELSAIGRVMAYTVNVADNEAVAKAYEQVCKDCGRK